MNVGNITRIALVTALASTLFGCSLLLDFQECEADSECGSGACIEGVCETPSCASTDECGAFGDDFTCVRSRCVQVDEAFCTVDEALTTEQADVLHIGVLLPFTGRNAAKAEATYTGARVAFEQINLASNGVRGVQLGALQCDTENNANRAIEVADYLANDLGVQSIIGSIGSDETLAVAGEVTVDAGVVLVTPASTNIAVSDIEDDDLVWRTIASDALQGPALAALVAQRSPENVLVLRLQNAYGEGLFDSFTRSDIVSIDSIETLTYQVDDSGDLVSDSIVANATELLVDEAYRPDAIVVMGSVESQQLIFALDDTFFADLPDDEKPIWILSEAGRDPGLLDARFEPVWPRIIGTIIQTLETPENKDFKLRFESSSELNLEEHPFADKAFDAAWMLALAHGAYEDPRATTGAEVAAKLGDLSSGDEFSPGDPLKAALDTLQSGTIDYQGASGPVDFQGSGDVTSDIASWAIVIDDQDAAVFQTNEVVYTADGELP